MLTYEQAQLLIKLPKKIIENHRELSEKYIDAPVLWQQNFLLYAQQDGETYHFLWQIWQSNKNRLKMSLHFQDNANKQGLFRIDYNSGHINPDFITDKVPLKFHPFVGKHFAINEHHVHYHVEGYKSLAWAIPIEEDDFPEKNISQSKIWDIILSFSKTINLQTKLYLNLSLNL